MNNIIYVASHDKRQILIWSGESSTPTEILDAQLFLYTSLFVTLNEMIYFGSSDEAGRIDKWPKGAMNGIFVTKFSSHCYDLFIDINNALYCSVNTEHRVDKVSLNDGTNTAIKVAGKGNSGTAVDELKEPWGIFVDRGFNLYVADGGNDRIQLFRSGQTIGETVAGLGVPANLMLKQPTDVILDADDFLYIVDNENHRIIRSKDDQFQCIIGCTNKNGSALDELNKPYAINFDSYGNLYVMDEYNFRVQKFILVTNSCGKYQQKRLVKDNFLSSTAYSIRLLHYSE